MSTVLYRKYRPQSFHDLTNQNHVKITLEQEVAQNKCAHAFVFSGPRGVGKTSSARILAKALNCTSRKDGTGEPCNKCEACKEITEGRSLDMIEIDAASHTGVEMVREVIIDTARFAPTRLKYKVFIVDEAHMLSTSAWNALLKILEEPPAHVIFILATTESHKIPPTILSRCQRFEFKRLSTADLIERLKFIASQEKKIVAPGVFQSIARLAEGSVRDAESLLEQVFALDEKEITEDRAALVLPRSSIPTVLDFLSRIFNNQAKEAIETLNHLVMDGIDLSQFSLDIVEVLRKMILLKARVGAQSVFSFDLEEELEKRLKEASANISMGRLLFLIELFLRKQQDLKNTVIPQLPLELAVVEAVEAIDNSSGEPKVSPPPATVKEEKIINQPLIKKIEVKATPVLKEKEEETTETGNGLDKTVNFEEIKQGWQKFLAAVQKENPSLPFILKLSEPKSLENNKLKIGVAYAFHRDRLNEEKNRAFMEKILFEQFGARLKIEGVLMEKPPQQDDVLQDVLKEFGGKVVG
ncbi:MAG: DNA polymerase III subunit gamma/tau [bacterium]|nr:DNA polymerase III subunit gamma/tau [bacterium]